MRPSFHVLLLVALNFLPEPIYLVPLFHAQIAPRTPLLVLGFFSAFRANLLSTVGFYSTMSACFLAGFHHSFFLLFMVHLIRHVRHRVFLVLLGCLAKGKLSLEAVEISIVFLGSPPLVEKGDFSFLATSAC